MDSLNPTLSASSDPKTTLIQQVQQQAAINNARQLISKMNSHCFEKCIPTPGSSLSSREGKCFTTCMEKYMAAWNTVSRQYIGRIQKNTAGEIGSGGDMGELGL
ncbi:Tim10/DDP family zinc finger-domain-containing protein [Usnea florida]